MLKRTIDVSLYKYLDQSKLIKYEKTCHTIESKISIGQNLPNANKTNITQQKPFMPKNNRKLLNKKH